MSTELSSEYGVNACSEVSNEHFRDIRWLSVKLKSTEFRSQDPYLVTSCKYSVYNATQM